MKQIGSLIILTICLLDSAPALRIRRDKGLRDALVMACQKGGCLHGDKARYLRSTLAFVNRPKRKEKEDDAIVNRLLPKRRTPRRRILNREP
jgi:hypothetical protein